MSDYKEALSHDKIFDAYRALDAVGHPNYTPDNFLQQYGTTPQYIQWKVLERAATGEKRLIKQWKSFLEE